MTLFEFFVLFFFSFFALFTIIPGYTNFVIRNSLIVSQQKGYHPNLMVETRRQVCDIGTHFPVTIHRCLHAFCRCHKVDVGRFKTTYAEFFLQVTNQFRFQYEYLLPLETSCPEFTVFFVVYASRFLPINRPMAAVFASYINRNPGYFLKGFRDSPHLADIFRLEVCSILPCLSVCLSHRWGNCGLGIWEDAHIFVGNGGRVVRSRGDEHSHCHHGLAG